MGRSRRTASVTPDQGDPLRPISGKYYGYLIRAAQYLSQRFTHPDTFRLCGFPNRCCLAPGLCPPADLDRARAMRLDTTAVRARLAKIPGLRRTFRRGRALSRRVLRRNYPTILAVTEPNMPVVNFVRKHGCRQIAEIGCYRGHTTLELARVLDGDGSIHVFDFAEFVELVVTKLSNSGYENVVGFPSSRRTYDSYNWPLMRLLQEHSEPIYDFVLLDGAHTWPHDALAFLLVDRLIKPGGFIHFDDYDWCLALSPSLNPEVFPASKRNWTAEQLEEQHVRLIIETLVRPDPRWREIVPNQTFQKASLRD